MNQTPSTAVRSMPCWASLRLIAEPTRAGWWLAWDEHYPDLHYVTDGLTHREGLWIYHDGFWRRPSELGAEGWAGPVEMEKASPVETTPNNQAELSRPVSDGSQQKEKPNEL